MKRFWLCLALLLAALPLFGQAAAPNTLTPQEVEEGWVNLWDGRSFFGWEFHGDSDWTARDGVLLCKSGGPGWLGTTATFGDFELKLEFRTAADGNSGVFLRSARTGQPHRTGYELQIFDNQPLGFNTGSLVFYAKAQQPAKIIPDQWNNYDIRVEGSHFVIKLNGKVVFDGDNPTHASGVIGLQYNIDKPIEFRSIKLKPLGLQPLFDGKDLDGWSKVDRPDKPAEHNWTVRDGMLHVEKGAGQLETSKEFTNFVLQLGVRTNPPSADRHPNSGVFLRADKGSFWSGYESQIRNEFQYGDPKIPLDYGTGAMYNRAPAREIVAKDGEFFYKTIAAYERHVSVWVNGIQVTDFEDTRPEGKNARNQARLAGGVLSLQAHDPTTNIDFKDIRAAEVVARATQ